MLIPIIALIVLVGLGAYLFFTRPTAQEAQSPVSDVAFEETPSTSPVQDEEAFKQSQLDALAQAQAAKVEVDALIAKADEVMAKADEVLNTPAVEVAPVVETAPAVEAAPAEAKPKKKRRYYKPKAKK